MIFWQGIESSAKFHSAFKRGKQIQNRCGKMQISLAASGSNFDAFSAFEHGLLMAVVLRGQAVWDP